MVWRAGDVIGGRYEIRGPLGRSRTHEATDLHEGRRCALRALPWRQGAERAAFEAEARVASRGGPLGAVPRVWASGLLVEVLDVGFDSEREVGYLASALVRGCTLGEWLAARGASVPPGEALPLLADLAEALSVAHDHGVVHRDVRPGRVFVAEQPGRRPRLALFGFGLAPFADEVFPARSVLASSFEYAAPELVQDEGFEGPSADVCGFALVAHRMLLGHGHRRGRTVSELRSELSRPLVLPSVASAAAPLAAPEAFDRFFARAAASEPSERHASMREAMAELTEALEAWPRDAALEADAPRARRRGELALARAGREGRRDLGSILPDASTVRAPAAGGELEVWRTPVTQAQWEAVMGANASASWGPTRPVDLASWYDAVAFCQALSRAMGLDPAYELTDAVGWPGSGRFRATVAWRGPDSDGWRLPTEAEWDAFCQAGGPHVRHAELDAVAWHLHNAGGEPRPVGQKRPNPLGLCDLLGNVWEWCGDARGEGRVLRGGDVFAEFPVERPASIARAAAPESRALHQGFRPVRWVR
jgi:sulfatase modifying factor 1